jgi:hypothetical protein
VLSRTEKRLGQHRGEALEHRRPTWSSTGDALGTALGDEPRRWATGPALGDALGPLLGDEPRYTVGNELGCCSEKRSASHWEMHSAVRWEYTRPAPGTQLRYTGDELGASLGRTSTVGDRPGEEPEPLAPSTEQHWASCSVSSLGPHREALGEELEQLGAVVGLAGAALMSELGPEPGETLEQCWETHWRGAGSKLGEALGASLGPALGSELGQCWAQRRAGAGEQRQAKHRTGAGSHYQRWSGTRLALGPALGEVLGAALE